MEKFFIDAREMSHPVPLRTAIEYLQKMKDSDYIYMINNKKPTPLLAMVDEKGGFIHLEHLDENEVWHILITKDKNLDLKALLNV